jgi:glycosyltransferase involved in cell wall biosynthesis
MIAFHYPPFKGSSGVLRTLKFSKYLPRNGWEPIILTAHPRAYEETSSEQVDEVPENVLVHRAFALDTARHLSVNGAYFNWLALPDRWSSWYLGSVPLGLQLIRRHKPELLWSTYPIATAHLIGATLHRLTGIPWIADFRDPMAQEGYPADPVRWRAFKWIENQVVRHVARCIFTTPGALRLYADRYPNVPRDHFVHIANGYDEENFQNALMKPHRESTRGGRLVLLHSGVIYPSERDPRSLFAALADLKLRAVVSAQGFKLVLRATGMDDYYRRLLIEYGIEDLVAIESPITYQDALREMLSVDALLLLQAANCNDQIPAKLYEYLRARRPILALTDPAGDTAATLREAGIDTIARLDDPAEIALGLSEFLRLVRENRAPVAIENYVSRFSRVAGARALAEQMDQILEVGV